MSSLLLLGVMLLAFLLTVAGTSLLAARLGASLPTHWGRSSSVRAALAVLPVSLGIAVALSLVSAPTIFGGCHCIQHPHHIHLCFEHAAFSWGLVCLGALGAVALARSFGRIAAIARDVLETKQWAARLSATHDRTCNVDVSGELHTRAITVGLLKSRVFVGAALWAELGEDGRRALAAHEHAHVSRRDPLTLACLSLAASLMPRDAGRRLVDGWKRAAELACDRIAAHALADPYLLASTLVTCGKLQLGECAPANRSTTLAAAEDDLELRVSCLLEASQPTTLPRRPHSDLLGVGLLMTALTLTVTALGGELTHHAVETMLGWVS